MDLRFIPEFETLKSLFLNNYNKVYLNNSPKYLGCGDVISNIRESITLIFCITNKPMNMQEFLIMKVWILNI